MSIAQLQALYASYQTARAAGDYDGAIGAVADMIALLATTPDLEGSAGGGEQSIRFRSHDLQQLMAELRRLKAETLAAASATGPFQQTKITYARVTS